MNEKHSVRTETRYDDLAGAASLNFSDQTDFFLFAEQVAGVDLTKYEPISLRVFAIEKEIMVTVYALDKENYQHHYEQTGKLLVKKFKTETTLQQLFKYVKQLDFTMVSGEYDVEEFEVI